MAELVCSSCGTSYDTSGFEPGQRFRCRGDNCTEKLTVPADGVNTEETPTPAPDAELPRSGGKKRRKTTGKVKAAQPAVAAPVDDGGADEDVLEPKVPTAKAKRGGTGRRQRPGSGRAPAAEPARGRGGRGGPPQASNPAPMYAAIGGVVLILIIVVFAMMGKSTTPRRPSKGPKKNWKQNQPSKTAKAADEVPVPAATNAGDLPAEDDTAKKPTRRTRKDWRFIEKDGLASKLDGLADGLLDEDPNTAAEAAEDLFNLGTDMIPVMLNHMAGLKFLSMKERSKGYHMLEVVKEHLGWDARDKVGDAGEVNPRDNGAHGFRDAVKAWREYYKGTGVETKDVEIED